MSSFMNYSILMSSSRVQSVVFPPAGPAGLARRLGALTPVLSETYDGVRLTGGRVALLLFWRERREYFFLTASILSLFSFIKRASSSFERISDFSSSFFLFWEEARETFDYATLPELLIIDFSAWSRPDIRGGLDATGGLSFAATLVGSGIGLGYGR